MAIIIIVNLFPKGKRERAWPNGYFMPPANFSKIFIDMQKSIRLNKRIVKTDKL